MKNKKGFSLVELLIVIALIGLLISIAVPSGLKISKKIKQNMMDKKVELIEKGAIVWGQNNHSEIKNGTNCVITEEDSDVTACIRKSLDNLLTENALEADEIDELNGKKYIKNPTNNKIINGCGVEVYIKNKRVYATYDNYNDCYYETESGGEIWTELYLAKNIIRGNTLGTIPLTEPGKRISESTESVLMSTEDDYGTSYVYRGNVQNNYLNFAGMCWRIVRIQGDSSIKIILEDKDKTCETSSGNNWAISNQANDLVSRFGNTTYDGYKKLTNSEGKSNNSTVYKADFLSGEYEPSQSMASAFKKFQTSLNTKISTMYNGQNLSTMLKSGNWCLNDKVYSTTKVNLTTTTPLTDAEKINKYIEGTTFYYDAYVRLVGNATKTPTLKCMGTIINNYEDGTAMYVGTLTADEVVFAGGKPGTDNSNYYLVSTKSFLTFSLYNARVKDGTMNDYSFFVEASTGNLKNNFIRNRYPIRPSIVLNYNVKIKAGNGAKSTPYIVDES